MVRTQIIKKSHSDILSHCQKCNSLVGSEVLLRDYTAVAHNIFDEGRSEGPIVHRLRPLRRDDVQGACQSGVLDHIAFDPYVACLWIHVHLAKTTINCMNVF